MKVIHLSDLHIGRSIEESKMFVIFSSHISHYYPGTTVVITGDITDSGTEEQFAEASGLISLLKKTNPVVVVPGNHDYAWKGNIFCKDSWEAWLKYFGPEEITEGLSMVCSDGIWFFCVDSGDPSDKEISARGYISENLAAHLMKVLALGNGINKRIVLLHHHPFDYGFFTKLNGSDLLLDAVSGNCEALLFGHKHNLGCWRNLYDIPIIAASHKTTSETNITFGFLDGGDYHLKII